MRSVLVALSSVAMAALTGACGPSSRCPEGARCSDAGGPEDATLGDASLGDASLGDASLGDASSMDAHVEAGSELFDASSTDAGETDAGAPSEPLPDPLAIGGPFTVSAYGDSPFLTTPPIDELLSNGFSIGREFFVADWVAAPNATRPNPDGLGPLFHAPSCLACHPGAGRPPSLGADGSVAFGLLVRLTPADPTLGGQLQPSSIPSATAEGTITYVTYVTDGDRPAGVSAASARPVFTAAIHPTYGALSPSTRLGPRLSPQLAGMGLLELVPEDAILAWADPLDADGDGISGRAAVVRAGGGTALGRFGWKAVTATVRDQSAAAFAGDIGITSPDHPSDDCTPSQGACLALPAGGAPEISRADLDAVAIFLSFLAVPAARRDNDDPLMALGHRLFEATGCGRCHRSTLTTSPTAPLTRLAGVSFHPYTDLLLHDMGEALGGEAGEGDATAAEWRTPPLWGLGLVERQPHARFLHDGRAATLEDAIAWHGGEGAAARDAFLALEETERQALLAFLRSL